MDDLLTSSGRLIWTTYTDAIRTSYERLGDVLRTSYGDG